MTKSTSFWTIALAGVLAVGVTVYAGVPEQPVATSGFELVQGDANTAVLDQRHAAITARMAYKDMLVTGLVEHRYRLDEVAREFQKCIAGDPVALQALRMTYRGSGDEARAAQNVIEYVRIQPLGPRESAAAVAHFEAEFLRLYPAD